MESPLLYNPQKHEPEDWWRWRVLRDGVPVKHPVLARAGRNTVLAWFPKERVHPGPQDKPLPPGAKVVEEGASGGSIVILPAALVTIERRPAPVRPANVPPPVLVAQTFEEPPPPVVGQGELF